MKVIAMSYAGDQSKSSFRADKGKKFYLLYGDNEAAIENAKLAIVHAHLTPEEREENYREIAPSGAGATLKKVLPDMQSELATVSFLPDSVRVVTLYTVSDMFAAKSGSAKKTAASRSRKKAAETEDQPAVSYPDRLVDFLQKDMPDLPAVLIMIAIEDYEKFKRVSTSNPILQYAQKLGTAYQFKDDSPQFQFFDALFARQTATALSHWREWLRRTGNSPRPYYSLASQMRLLLQAKTASSQLQARGLDQKQFTNMLPPEAENNIFMIRPDWRREKYFRAAGQFSFLEILKAYEELKPLQKYAIPLATDPYVPDRNLLAELWIVSFTSRPDYN